MTPVSTGIRVAWDHKNGSFQCLSPRRESQLFSCLSGRGFFVRKWVPFICGSCTFQSGGFVLVFWLSEFVHQTFKSKFSVLCSSVVFLVVFFIGFQRRCFGVSSLLCKIYGLGCLMWSWNPLFFREKVLTFVIPPDCSLLLLGCRFFSWQDCISVSFTRLSAALLPFIVEALFIQFAGPFLRELSYM